MASDELKGGRLDDLGDSLAEYLEEAFDFIRVNDYELEPLTPEGRDERMMLFLGIGRGVVRYLADHAAAFVIDDHDSTQPWGHTNTKTGHVRIEIESED